MGNHIIIDKASVLEAYKHASEEHKKVLEDLFGEDVLLPKDITERIKTFQDAVRLLGYDNQTVIDYHRLNYINSAKDIIAFAKLRVITEALNEGWKPMLNKFGYGFYPRFFISKKEEYDKLNENDKKECFVVPLSNDCGAYDSPVFVFERTYHSVTVSSYGSRLAFKTKALAEYCGKQFIDIWADYLFA